MHVLWGESVNLAFGLGEAPEGCGGILTCRLVNYGGPSHELQHIVQAASFAGRPLAFNAHRRTGD